MSLQYWLKQTKDKPLFPGLLWSRPENKTQAGKLLIAGGNAHGFAAPAEAYAEAETAGIGTARVLLPDKLQKTVAKVFPAAEYTPSTPSGGFSQQALATFLEASSWSDGVLLAGDFGKGSETAILLEKFIKDYSGQLTLAQDTINYFVSMPDRLLGRADTLLVAEFAQLQKLAVGAHFPKAFTSNMDLLRLIENLHEFTKQYAAGIITSHLGNAIVAIDGQVSTNKVERAPDIIATAAHAAVWWLQNPGKPFESITTSTIK